MDKWKDTTLKSKQNWIKLMCD